MLLMRNGLLSFFIFCRNWIELVLVFSVVIDIVVSVVEYRFLLRPTEVFLLMKKALGIIDFY